MGENKSKPQYDFHICGKFKIGCVCLDASNCTHTVQYGNKTENMSRAVLLRLFKTSGIPLPEHFKNTQRQMDVGVMVKEKPPAETIPVQVVAKKPSIETLSDIVPVQVAIESPHDFQIVVA